MDPNIYALVLDTLNKATSQDTEVLKPAEKKTAGMGDRTRILFCLIECAH